MFELSEGNAENSLIRKVKPKSMKKTIFKLLLFTVCAIALVYHSYLLFKQYFSGGTVVNIRLEQTIVDSMPALTICYPYGLNMKGMAEKYPELSEKYRQYKQLIDLNKNNNNETLKNDFKNIYHYFTEFYQKQNLPLNELLESDISIPFNKLKNSSEIIINNDTDVIRVNYFTITKRIRTDRNPVVSFVNQEPGRIRKCFTFFSQTKQEWMDLKTNLNRLYATIEIDHDKDWFPPSIYERSVERDQNKIYFSMHSSNALPYDMRSENFLNLEMGKYYEILYSTTKTILLPKGYDTNCHNYNPGESDANKSKTRSDCIFKCYRKHIEKYEQCYINKSHSISTRQYNFHSTNFLRDYLLDNTKNFSIAINWECEAQSDDFCRNKCRKDCIYYYYKIDIKESNDISDKSSWDMKIKIDLHHNSMLDQVVTHSPEMSHIQFIANFGGLIGLWLGFSALVILENIVKTFRIIGDFFKN